MARSELLPCGCTTATSSQPRRPSSLKSLPASPAVTVTVGPMVVNPALISAYRYSNVFIPPATPAASRPPRSPRARPHLGGPPSPGSRALAAAIRASRARIFTSRSAVACSSSLSRSSHTAPSSVRRTRRASSIGEGSGRLDVGGDGPVRSAPRSSTKVHYAKYRRCAGNPSSTYDRWAVDASSRHAKGFLIARSREARGATRARGQVKPGGR
jgi:hypothetical protein